VRPDSSRLVSMDSRRLFAGQVRHLIVLRDQFRRMPWCDAPIRHGDHTRPHRDEGPTAEENAQGLCEACSYAKEAPDWDVAPVATTGAHSVVVTTPTGERYPSRAPDPPGMRSD
jgi:HNH endonuclease